MLGGTGSVTRLHFLPFLHFCKSSRLAFHAALLCCNEFEGCQILLFSEDLVVHKVIPAPPKLRKKLFAWIEVPDLQSVQIFSVRESTTYGMSMPRIWFPNPLAPGACQLGNPTSRCPIRVPLHVPRLFMLVKIVAIATQAAREEEGRKEEEKEGGKGEEK